MCQLVDGVFFCELRRCNCTHCKNKNIGIRIAIVIARLMHTIIAI